MFRKLNRSPRRRGGSGFPAPDARFPARRFRSAFAFRRKNLRPFPTLHLRRPGRAVKGPVGLNQFDIGQCDDPGAQLAEVTAPRRLPHRKNRPGSSGNPKILHRHPLRKRTPADCGSRNFQPALFSDHRQHHPAQKERPCEEKGGADQQRRRDQHPEQVFQRSLHPHRNQRAKSFCSSS